MYGERFLGLVVGGGLEAGQVLFGVSACRARVEQVEEEVLSWSGRAPLVG
jgi:hypothetical protein